MAINIGLIIWKEINARSLSRSVFSEMTGIPKSKLTKIISSGKIDVDLLTQISNLLEVNFFEYYYHDYQLNKFNKTFDADKRESVIELSDIFEQKNKLLKLKDDMINNQSQTIKQLEAKLMDLI